MSVLQQCRLSVERLSVARGERIICENISFQLRSGCSMELSGPNGVGKSTLLRAIAGFIPAAAGRVRWTEPCADEHQPLAERLHYMGHLDGLKGALTARENLQISVAMAGHTGLSPREALERIELPHVLNLPVGLLSAGQRRRVALARLLVAGRPLWLLDEPFTALDRQARALLKAILIGHLSCGGLVMAATHEALGLPGAFEMRLERQ